MAKIFFSNIFTQSKVAYAAVLVYNNVTILFRAVALSHGVDWEGMCESDNTGCPESP